MMTQKIFNLGFPKTGTSSLERALQILGYDVCRGHWQNHYTNYLLALYVNGDYESIIRLTRHFDAFSDAPWGGSYLYLRLADAYPDAKFVVTQRDTDSWFNSLLNSIERLTGPVDDLFDGFHAHGRFGPALFYEQLFGLKHLRDDPEHVKNIYRGLNAEIVDFLKNRGLNYVVMNISSGDGWARLCPLLGVPVPETDFPAANVAPAKRRSIGPDEAVQIARNYHANGQIADARDLCQKVLAKVPDHSDAKALLASLNASADRAG